MTLLYLILIWNLIPHFIVWILPVPFKAKMEASKSFVASAVKGLTVLVPALLAPIVVPIALLFTSREAEKLPWLFTWWDNDVSINGDHPWGTETYYAPGHDRRGFWARYVWLGWRNRASKLALMMGYKYKEGEYQDSQTWGDPATGRDHEGWALNRRGDCWQLYAIKRVGSMCIRVNYGHKVWSGAGDNGPVAMVINITASLLSWEGTK